MVLKHENFPCCIILEDAFCLSFAQPEQSLKASTGVTAIGHFQVLKGTSFLEKMIFICKRMKTHLRIKG